MDLDDELQSSCTFETILTVIQQLCKKNCSNIVFFLKLSHENYRKTKKNT